ncbi:MAG: hypothetical protein WBA28_02520 [Microbacteriaceae bacterium]
MPTRTPKDLAKNLIGAWQLTHINTGAGLEPVSADIRYIFPAEGQMIYCQNVPGVTDHAEQSTTITIERTRISPPGSHKGFEVLLMDDTSMAWVNNTDSSSFLLVRR